MRYAYGYRPMYYGMDWTYLLVLLALVLSLIVQAKMKSTFRKYSQVRSMSGLTGAQAAQHILQSEGIFDVQVRHVSGSLTDHYDPRSKTVNLSDTTYGSASVAALGVAAHECGHAIQHARDYAPLAWRSAILPAASFGSKICWPLFVAGLLFSFRPLLYVGIVMFAAVLLFQLVTLPVEFNASSRALAKLENGGYLRADEIGGTRKVLNAAAMTYVAAALSSLLQLARMILLSGRRSSRR